MMLLSSSLMKLTSSALRLNSTAKTVGGEGEKMLRRHLIKLREIETISLLMLVVDCVEEEMRRRVEDRRCNATHFN